MTVEVSNQKAAMVWNKNPDIVVEVFQATFGEEFTQKASEGTFSRKYSELNATEKAEFKRLLVLHRPDACATKTQKNKS